MSGAEDKREVRAEEPSLKLEDLKVEENSQSNGSVGSKVVYDGSGDVIPLYDGREFLLYFDWIFRFWIYWDTIPHTVAYFSVFGFFVGGILFIIGTFSALSPAVQATRRPLSCGADAYSWWTQFPYLLGDVLWLLACALQVVESLNGDYEDRLEVWAASKRSEARPRYRWFGFRLTSFEWWGAMHYEVGVGLYLTAQIFTYISLCPDTQLSNNLKTICVNYFFLTAGVLFLIAGVLYIPALGSSWILPNILVPFQRHNWASMMWWAIWLYFWGGVLFFMSGLFLYWYSPNNMKLDLQTYQIENSIGFGGGAFLFMIGAVLLLMRQSRGRCRPSFQALNTNCDLSVHGGNNYKPVSRLPPPGDLELA